MSPVGCGDPPAGSMVTASDCAWAVSEATAGVVEPLSPSASSPALVGPDGPMTQSWYVLSAGTAGSPELMNTASSRCLEETTVPDTSPLVALLNVASGAVSSSSTAWALATSALACRRSWRCW